MHIKTFSLGLFLAITTSSTALALPAPEAEPAPAPASEDEGTQPMLVRGRPSVTYSSNNAVSEVTTDGDPNKAITNVNYGTSYDSASSESAPGGTLPVVNPDEYYNSNYDRLIAALQRKQAGNSWPNSPTGPGSPSGGGNNFPVRNSFGFPSQPMGLSMRLMPEGDGASAIA